MFCFTGTASFSTFCCPRSSRSTITSLAVGIGEEVTSTLPTAASIPTSTSSIDVSIDEARLLLLIAPLLDKFLAPVSIHSSAACRCCDGSSARSLFFSPGGCESRGDGGGDFAYATSLCTRNSDIEPERGCGEDTSTRVTVADEGTGGGEHVGCGLGYREKSPSVSQKAICACAEISSSRSWGREVEDAGVMVEELGRACMGCLVSCSCAVMMQMVADVNSLRCGNLKGGFRRLNGKDGWR
jgi:hypothetical protein